MGVEQENMVEGGRVPGILTAYKDVAGNNLGNLEQLLTEYFEEGSGMFLPPEKQSHVESHAKWLVFHWSAHELGDERKFDEDEQESYSRGRDDLKQELDIISYSQLRENLRQFQLTGYQENGINKRAWVLAEKATGKK